MRRSKLIRNLKRGDRIRLTDIDGKRTAVITVAAVQERRQSWFTGRRMWEVCSPDWPWWWGLMGITGYSDTRIDLE
jgi:hypothetical protein